MWRYNTNCVNVFRPTVLIRNSWESGFPLLPQFDREIRFVMCGLDLSSVYATLLLLLFTFKRRLSR
jgi:hypothetical protein